MTAGKFFCKYSKSYLETLKAIREILSYLSTVFIIRNSRTLATYFSPCAGLLDFRCVVRNWVKSRASPAAELPRLVGMLLQLSALAE